MGKFSFNRRNFLKFAGAASVALGFSAGAASARASAPAQGGTMTADEMDAMHEKGVKTFVDNIGKDPNFWGVPMKFTMDGDTKVFQVTTTQGNWEAVPGQPFKAMMYNGRVPGEYIRVTEGDKIRVVLTNNMDQSTSIHFHGLPVPNDMDGVPFITQKPVKPGATFTYEFVVPNFGTHMYHSHHNSTEQVTGGLLAAFISDPKDKSKEPKVDAEYMMVLNDVAGGFTINGRGFPYTQPIIAKKGDKIRIRYMNEGLMIHPFHLHGLPQTVFAKDGFYLPAPYMADTVLVAPGERYDVTVDCNLPGIWAYHCHILSHAESNQGMFGMVTAVVVK